MPYENISFIWLTGEVSKKIYSIPKQSWKGNGLLVYRKNS